MKKNILLLFFLFVIQVANAQSHSYKMGCRFFRPPVTQGKAVSGEVVCSACAKQSEDESQARIAENKRRADVAAAEEKARAEKIKADRAAADLKEKIEADKRKQRDEALKELAEYSRNHQQYFDKIKIDVNRSYPGYDAVKASQAISPKIKSLKLVDNNFAKTYELYSGEVLVKSFSQQFYWVSSLDNSLPYFIISERQSKTPRKSIIDSKGEPLAIAGEKHFESIQFNRQNNTLEFEIAQEQHELLSNFCLDEILGLYTSKADALKMKNIAELEIEKRPKVPDEYDSNGRKVIKLGGICIHPYGYAVKRIVTGLDLAVLENRNVYRVASN